MFDNFVSLIFDYYTSHVHFSSSVSQKSIQYLLNFTIIVKLIHKGIRRLSHGFVEEIINISTSTSQDYVIYTRIFSTTVRTLHNRLTSSILQTPKA